MEKVYWLLRNGLEQGPYTIDELLQQNLQSSDLIREVVTTDWQTPATLEGLAGRGFGPAASSDFGTNYYSEKSSAGNLKKGSEHYGHKVSEAEDFEQRAKELQENVLRYKPAYTRLKTPLQTRSEAKPVSEIEDGIDLVIHKKDSEVYTSYFVVAGLVFGLFIFAWYKGSIVNRVQQDNNIAAQPLIVPVATSTPEDSGGENSFALATAATSSELSLRADTQLQVPAETKKILQTGKKIEKRPVISKKQILTDSIIVAEIPPLPPESSISKSELPVDDTVKENPPVVQETKKTIGQAIKGLFKKKNRKTDTVQSQ